MTRPPTTVSQVLSLMLISLVTGSMFGIWQGYNPASYSPAAFLEVQQGAIRGLNILLPAMGLAAIVLTGALAYRSRKSPPVFWLYVAAGIAMAAAGLITRFANQPINDIVMGWSASTLPENWAALRDGWWGWHLARLAAGLVALLLLITAVFSDRDSKNRRDDVPGQ